MEYYVDNTQLDLVVPYIDNNSGSSPPISPFTITTYPVNGTFTLSASTLCDVLVVGGGGSGGRRHGGGGGGGAAVYLTNQTIPAGTYTITVGAGGAAVPAGTPGTYGNPGSDSSIGSLFVAKGGGRGMGGNTKPANILDGGCGGGSSETLYDPAGSAVSTNVPAGVYGYAGGLGASSGASAQNYAGGGGGGAGGVGQNGILGTGNASGGNGGDGLRCSITGIATYYGGGGGGGCNINGTSAGAGGLGGGGAGSKGPVTATSGTANTGGGGGGSGFDVSNGESGAGGSGIVIIKQYGTPGTTFREMIRLSNTVSTSMVTSTFGINASPLFANCIVSISGTCFYQNGTFTIGRKGIYYVHFSIRSSSTTFYKGMAMVKNGSTYIGSTAAQYSTGAAGSHQISQILQFEAFDSFVINLFTSGVSTTFTLDANFNAEVIRLY